MMKNNNNVMGFDYNPAYDVNQCDQQAVNAYVAKVFGWMFIGLLVTALTTFALLYGINASYAFTEFIQGFQSVAFLAILLQFGLVIALSARVAKMNPTTAKFMYLFYAALNGFTFGLVAVVYAYATGGGMQTLGMAFGITALCFGIMAIYGLVTKSDLTRFGNLLWMGLIGLIIVSVVNIFMRSGPLDFLICVFGLFLFLGITAHRTHMIKHYFARAALGGFGNDVGYNQYDGHGEMASYASIEQERLASNLAIVGALMLYLAFMNIFMFVLRLMGGGGRR